MDDNFSFSSGTTVVLEDGVVAWRTGSGTVGAAAYNWNNDQWIDGSFVEDVESTRNRPPKDIDVVTLFNRPLKYFSDPKLWAHDYRAFLHNDFFNTLTIKPKYHCDTYCIDMDGDPFSSVSSATYWFGLFSEQRGSSRRKGIVEVPLATDPMEFQRVDSQLAVKFNV